MRNHFIIWIIGMALLITSQLRGQMQFEASAQYGQVLDVVFAPQDPNTVYARTVANHIVKSTNMGGDWEVIRSLPQENHYITVKDLRLTADGSSISYICAAEGTGFNRIEIMDLATETVVKEIYSPIGAVDGSLIQSYSISKDNTDIVLMHTTRMVNWGLVTEIFYTVDAGENWESVYFGPDNGNINVNNVAISPYDSQRLFIMRGASPDPVEGGLLISDDGGFTWEEKLPHTNFSALTFHPENEDELYLGTFYLGPGQEQNLYKSTDGGETWNVVPLDWTSQSTNSIHVIAYNPANPENIIILEENEVVITTDGGQNWVNHVYTDPDYEEDYYYGTWVSFDPFVENQVIITANYYPFISQDGGVTMAKFRTPFVNTSGHLAIHKKEEKHLYYGLRNGYIHKNLQTGEETENGLLPLGQFSNQTRSGTYADTHQPGRLFFSNMSMMGNSSLFMSDDHGQNFTSVFSGSYLFLIAQASLPSNPDIALISFGEMLYKFDFSDLENVTNQEFMLPSFGVVMAMLFDENNEDEFFIAQGNKLYHTEDGGQTWQDSSTGMEILSGSDYIYDVKRNPLNPFQLAIGSTLGVFVSDDNGANWQQVYSESPMDRVEFSPYEDGKIVASSIYQDGSAYAASDSKTVFSKDGGETWEEISTDLLGYLITNSTEIIFNDENSADVYFQVMDLGLIKYNLDLTTLSTGDFTDQNSQIQIYPNPTSGILNIDSESEILQLNMYDLSGKKVSVSKSSQMNISALPKGVYILNILTKDGKKSTQKIIKN